MGFCMAYFIFVAQNVTDLIAVFSECKYVLDEVSVIFMQLVLYIPLSLIRRLKTFALTALIADAFILFGLVYIFVYDIEHLAKFGAARVMQFNPDRFALYIGTACYTFEGIGMIIPICNAMKEPRRFPRLLLITMVITTTVYIIIGGLSYLSFGDGTNSIVLLNLPPGSGWTQTAQFLYISRSSLPSRSCCFQHSRSWKDGYSRMHQGRARRTRKQSGGRTCCGPL